MNIGYIRVSTKEQHIDRQIEELKKYDIEERFLFIDRISGNIKANNRPNYESLKRVIRPGDILYIHELDRLGRNKEDIVKELQFFKDNQVQVKILDIPTTLIDIKKDDKTSTLLLEMINNLLIEVMSTLAQAELERNKKRQMEGIIAARLQGRRAGRPRIPFPDEWEKYYTEWKDGQRTAVATRKILGITHNTFYSLVRRYEEKKGKYLFNFKEN